MARVFNNQSSTDATIRAIDRKREQERRFMLSQAFKNAEEISTRLVQRLIDRHVIEKSCAGPKLYKPFSHPVYY